MTTHLLFRSQPGMGLCLRQTLVPDLWRAIHRMQGSRNTFLCQLVFSPLPSFTCPLCRTNSAFYSSRPLPVLNSAIADVFLGFQTGEIGKFHKIAGLVRPAANLTCSLITQPQPGLPLLPSQPLCESLPGHERGGPVSLYTQWSGHFCLSDENS